MSAARKLQPDAAKSVSKDRGRQMKRKTKKRVEYIHFESRRHRIPRQILFTVVLIFAGGVGTAMSFAMLQSVRHEIDSTRIAIQTQVEDNMALRAVVHPRFSVEEIDRIARERLNMGPPDASQIVRINVPREDYVIQSDERGLLQQNRGMWHSAFRYIRNWLGV